jgi:hypothetical protein
VQGFGVYGTLPGAGALLGVPDPPVPASSVRFRAGCLLGIERNSPQTSVG